MHSGPRIRAAAAALAALALLLPACGSSPSKAKAAAPTTAARVAPSTTPPAPTSTVPPYPIALSAVAKDDVDTVGIYDSPADAEPSRSLSNPNPFYGPDFPRVFLVQEQTPDWLKVMLPMRPNGTTGWIKKADVDLQPATDYRILVELSQHRLTLYEKNDVVMQEPVGVGTSATPSTAGFFYTTELIKVLPDQQSAYGPYAFGLSAYSEVHYTFGGGDGQMGIHGTGDPSSVGKDVSNGCIRMTNDAITQLANTIPGRGVPVEIRA